MSDKESDFDDEIFGMHFPDDKEQNQRVAVRYIRPDITATLTIRSFLYTSKTIAVKLLDISSKGVAIECPQKLTLRQKTTITLCFESQTFNIAAKVVHHHKQKYGLQFDKFNHELGDHLLMTQQNLDFK